MLHVHHPTGPSPRPTSDALCASASVARVSLCLVYGGGGGCVWYRLGLVGEHGGDDLEVAVFLHLDGGAALAADDLRHRGRVHDQLPGYKTQKKEKGLVICWLPYRYALAHSAQ